MKKLFTFMIAALVICCLLTPCAYGNILNLTKFNKKSIKPQLREILWEKLNSPALKSKKKKRFKQCISLVKLSGKINHFGCDMSNNPPTYIDYHATVPGVKVWIDEYPFTKHLNIHSDENGWWTIYLIKYRGIDLEFSFVYEKEGWITTKSNIIKVTDEDNPDIAIQFIDPDYYNLAIKPGIEQNLSNWLGIPVTLNNAVVVTVGKSWASMHDDRLPHGDPGATVIASPLSTAIGPIYFNEAVQPDPTYPSTSVDGGVAFINIPAGKYDITAEKAGFEYDTVKFNITETDVTNGVKLYIASPPDSVEGNNDSGPGLP